MNHNWRGTKWDLISLLIRTIIVQLKETLLSEKLYFVKKNILFCVLRKHRMKYQKELKQRRRGVLILKATIYVFYKVYFVNSSKNYDMLNFTKFILKGRTHSFVWIELMIISAKFCYKKFLIWRYLECTLYQTLLCQ